MHCGYQSNLYHPIIYGPLKKSIDELKKCSCHAAVDRDLWPLKESSLRGRLLFRWYGHCLTYRGEQDNAWGGLKKLCYFALWDSCHFIAPN